MRYARAVGLWSLLLAVAACSDVQAPEERPRVTPEVMTSIAASPIGAIPGFRFDAPIVAGPTLKGPGTFDGSLVDLLAIEVCESSAGSCVGAPIRRITAQDPLPAKLHVVTAAELYRANWNTALDALDPARTYRLRVMAGPTELGYAELDIVSPSDDGPTSAPGLVRVVNGSTLPVTFRIDQGLGVRVGPAGTKVTLAGGDVTLDVPAGAVGVDVLFTAVPATNLPSNGPATVPGTAWEFGPSGIVFATPVTLTIKYDPALIPPGLQESELRIHKLVNGTYVQQNAGSIDLVAHTASAQIDGFSVLVLLQRLFPGSHQDVQGAAMTEVEFLDPNTNTYSPSLSINTSGSDVTVMSRVTITDDISGAEYIDVRLRSPSGQQMRFTCFPYPFRPPTNGSDTNGEWDCTSTWPQYSESGAWTVQIIYVRDKALNWTYFMPGNAGICDNFGQGTRCLTAPPQVNVTSTPSDVTPAQVLAFEVSLDVQPRNYGPTVSVDASVSARQLVFRLHVTDALSGAGPSPNEFFWFRIDGPSGQYLYYSYCTLVQGTPADGYWECPITIPQSAAAGTWSVGHAFVTDRVGNNSYYTGRGFSRNGTQLCSPNSACITPPTVTVTSAGDGEAPLLQSVAIAATNADVHTTLGLTDNLAGATYAIVIYSSVSANQSQNCYASRTAGTPANGTYACQITFSQFAARGQWVLSLQLYDAAGNVRYYNRRASDGYLCYLPPGGGAQVCQDFGTTDLRLQ